MNVKIYCIFDETGIPLYVGKTKQKLSVRESQHRRRLKQKVFIYELDLVKMDEWKFWESYWIDQFKSWDFNLLNKNKGGGGPEFHPETIRKKMSLTPRPQTSQKLKGRKRPDVSKRMKGSTFSSETCEKISKAKTGTIYSEERNKKIKKSNEKHYKLNSERNKQISKKLKGRSITWISKIKIPVYQFDKNGNFIRKWDSASSAAFSLNKPSSAISECCNGKRKSAYNYIWKFQKEYLNLK